MKLMENENDKRSRCTLKVIALFGTSLSQAPTENMVRGK